VSPVTDRERYRVPAVTDTDRYRVSPVTDRERYRVPAVTDKERYSVPAVTDRDRDRLSQDLLLLKFAFVAHNLVHSDSAHVALSSYPTGSL
jgi:hypothetical protein